LGGLASQSKRSQTGDDHSRPDPAPRFLPSIDFADHKLTLGLMVYGDIYGVREWARIILQYKQKNSKSRNCGQWSKDSPGRWADRPFINEVG
jgi:hypothetical protein